MKCSARARRSGGETVARKTMNGVDMAGEEKGVSSNTYPYSLNSMAQQNAVMPKNGVEGTQQLVPPGGKIWNNSNNGLQTVCNGSLEEEMHCEDILKLTHSTEETLEDLEKLDLQVPGIGHENMELSGSTTTTTTRKYITTDYSPSLEDILAVFEDEENEENFSGESSDPDNVMDTTKGCAHGTIDSYDQICDAVLEDPLWECGPFVEGTLSENEMNSNDSDLAVDGIVCEKSPCPEGRIYTEIDSGPFSKGTTHDNGLQGEALSEGSICQIQQNGGQHEIEESCKSELKPRPSSKGTTADNGYKYEPHRDGSTSKYEFEECSKSGLESRPYTEGSLRNKKEQHYQEDELCEDGDEVPEKERSRERERTRISSSQEMHVLSKEIGKEPSTEQIHVLSQEIGKQPPAEPTLNGPLEGPPQGIWSATLYGTPAGNTKHPEVLLKDGIAASPTDNPYPFSEEVAPCGIDSKKDAFKGVPDTINPSTEGGASHDIGLTKGVVKGVPDTLNASVEEQVLHDIVSSDRCKGVPDTQNPLVEEEVLPFTISRNEFKGVPDTLNPSEVEVRHDIISEDKFKGVLDTLNPSEEETVPLDNGSNKDVFQGVLDTLLEEIIPQGVSPELDISLDVTDNPGSSSEKLVGDGNPLESEVRTPGVDVHAGIETLMDSLARHSKMEFTPSLEDLLAECGEDNTESQIDEIVKTDPNGQDQICGVEVTIGHCYDLAPIKELADNDDDEVSDMATNNGQFRRKCDDTSVMTVTETRSEMTKTGPDCVHENPDIELTTGQLPVGGDVSDKNVIGQTDDQTPVGSISNDNIPPVGPGSETEIHIECDAGMATHSTPEVPELPVSPGEARTNEMVGSLVKYTQALDTFLEVWKMSKYSSTGKYRKKPLIFL